MLHNESNHTATRYKAFACWLMLIFCAVSTASAWDFDVDRIPNGEVFSCDTCHRSGSNQLNAFGSAYGNAGDTWTVNLANADSDADGYSNGVELLDPEGSWQIGQADPGHPQDVTNPGNSSSHPADQTPTSTPTQTPAATSTPTPNPTSTPDACTSTGVTIRMPGTLFHPGDRFFCSIVVCNRESTPLDGYPLVVILDVFGQYFFAPSFDSTFDFYSQIFPVGSSTTDVLPEFTWPQGAGTAAGVIWYAALTDQSVTSLVGQMDSWTFGWTE
ncbi:hypothetical protein JW823_01895 [bacterium]|nr:hypothetical protein [candidate division CSSED10-310 bacterium]